MRKLSDLLREEPVALTGLVSAAANVIMATGAIEVSTELVASVNVLIGAVFMALRWLVFSPATVAAMAGAAATAGYDMAVADVKSLTPPLAEMTKAELLVEAGHRGIHVATSATKAEIISALEA